MTAFNALVVAGLVFYMASIGWLLTSLKRWADTQQPQRWALFMLPIAWVGFLCFLVASAIR